MKFKKTIGMVLVACMSVGALAGCEKKETNAGTDEETFTFLNCWQGSDLPQGVDFTHNPVADVIAEKTGVRLQYLSCATSEAERLNLAFSTGDVPDIVSAAFWGAHDTHTMVIKKAAEQGLLLPMNEYVEKYAPNLKDAWSPDLISNDFLENDFEPASFNGEHYFYPRELRKSDLDRDKNNAYNAYIRKDIIEALGVDPKSITDSEKLYELMKKVKAGDFKDVNGNDVIVSGTWHSGWTAEPFYNSYVSQRDMFSSFKHENGEIKFDQNTERYKQKILYLRKLRAEGLFDLECSTQTSAQAIEKVTCGKVAIVGGTYSKLYTTLHDTLYVNHPEMQYIPLGPIINLDGEPYQNTGVARNKWAGGGVIFVSAKVKNPEKVMKFLDFMSSDEGVLLSTYGIEGTHYTMVDGKPRLTEEWLGKYKKSISELQKEGVALYNRFALKLAKATRFGETEYGMPLNEFTPEEQEAMDASPKTFVDDVYSLNFVATRYPKWDDILTLMNTGDGGLMSKAATAATEEEALSYIEKSREFFANNGMKEFEEWMTAHQNDKGAELAAIDAANAAK